MIFYVTSDYTVIFISNISVTKDYIYDNFHGVVLNKGVAFAKADRNSGTIRMENSDYVNKLDTMIDDSMKGTYLEADDNTLTLVCTKWAQEPKNNIFGPNFYLKNGRKLRLYVFLHFHARKTLDVIILPELKQTHKQF